MSLDLKFKKENRIRTIKCHIIYSLKTKTFLYYNNINILISRFFPKIVDFTVNTDEIVLYTIERMKGSIKWDSAEKGKGVFHQWLWFRKVQNRVYECKGKVKRVRAGL